ncbi:MAG: hypothetical protein ACI9XP_001082 [Lentimonas sp.]|jgi:hypothetical protein
MILYKYRLDQCPDKVGFSRFQRQEPEAAATVKTIKPTMITKAKTTEATALKFIVLNNGNLVVLMYKKIIIV